jgi:hypothetical protein
MESLNSISAPADIGSFVSGQNVSVKVYPPPKADFKPPDLPSPKQPDAPPINLVSENIQDTLSLSGLNCADMDVLIHALLVCI